MRMQRLVNRWSFSVCVLFLAILILRILKKYGVRPSENGWRKVTRVFLRTEESKFALACFNIDLSSTTGIKDKADDPAKIEAIAGKMRLFFKQHKDLLWEIRWKKFAGLPAKNNFADFVHSRFDDLGRLISLVPLLDHEGASEQPDQEKKNICLNQIIKIFNATKDTNDKVRPLILLKKLKSWIQNNFPKAERITISRFAFRVLASTFLNFEHVTSLPELGDKRFASPDFSLHKHPGHGMLNIIIRCEKTYAAADFWVQSSHMPIDGMPLQEILNEFKKQFGQADLLRFPRELLHKEPAPVICSTQGKKPEVYIGSKVINFGPLLKIRKELTRQNLKEQKIGITTLRLIIWKIGTHPAFKGKKLLIPIDLRKDCSGQRTLGFVIIRPSIYQDYSDKQEGMLAFHKEFNRQVKSTLSGESETYEFLDNYALLSPCLYSGAMRLIPRAVQELTGSIGISIIPNAEAFLAPYSDVHTDGFIALSRLFTPLQDQGTGCFVSVKGPKEKVIEYIKALEEIAGQDNE